MKSIIVGTAGHIDHGKTALVKALTGIDADRLQEEKRRGITIDLGFAHLDLPTPEGEVLRLGFVDVPGHERFVRNMLAGVGGIDLVLLVIAADESIKPQTREHFDILQLLGIRRGITVLTKADAVDADTLEVVRLEVEEFLRGTFLESSKSPIVAVSSLTGAGLDHLKRALSDIATEVQPKDSRALTRLPIDRVFTMKGFGTVVTGTLVSGTIQKEDELEVFPGGRKIRVRGVQVHGESAANAIAGQRTALNLVGASTEQLARGMMLGPPNTFAPTRTLDVRLRLLPSAPRALKDGAQVHFHAYSMEALGHVAFHRSSHLNPELMQQDRVSAMAPGAEAFARVRLSKPALLLPGDRFIIRQFSPVVTIGGGIVLDATPIRGLKPAMIDGLLKDFTSGDLKARLCMRVSRRWFEGLTMAQAVAETGWRPAFIEDYVSRLLADGKVFRFAELLLSSAALSELKILLAQTVSTFHQQNPLVSGMAKEELRDKLKLRPEVFAAVLDSLMHESKLEITGDIVRLPGRSVVMKDEESESKKKIELAFASAGLKVPALSEVVAGLKIDKVRAQKIITLLLRDRILIKLSDDLVFHRSALEQLRKHMSEHKSKSPTIDVATFKELAGVSRKYAIPLLEYLDRERVTKRIGDARQIL